MTRMLALSRPAPWRLPLVLTLAVLTTGSLATAATASGSPRPDGTYLRPGNLLVSRSVYVNRPGTIQAGVTVLPPGCTTGCAVASSDGTYPTVFNNDLVDGSFGVTSPVFLDQLTPDGHLVSTLRVPAPSGHGFGDGMVTSFSSKSELALNLSTSGRDVTVMGYVAPADALDVSNSNTPGVAAPTNPVGESDYRVVAQLNADGRFHFTQTNAYSGNNGRAAGDGINPVYFLDTTGQACPSGVGLPRRGRRCRSRHWPTTRRWCRARAWSPTTCASSRGSRPR